jgi:uncharacterized protein YqkB
MYLAIKNGTVYKAYTLTELSTNIAVIEIDDKGKVFINGEMDTISYNTEKFTRGEMYIDFCNTRMTTVLKRKGIEIYKVEQL